MTHLLLRQLKHTPQGFIIKCYSFRQKWLTYIKSILVYVIFNITNSFIDLQFSPSWQIICIYGKACVGGEIVVC